jgi:hypothetical protein
VCARILAGDIPVIFSRVEAGLCHNDLLGQAHDAQRQIAVLPGNMLVMLRAGAWRRLVRPRDGRKASRRHRPAAAAHPRGRSGVGACHHCFVIWKL